MVVGSEVGRIAVGPRPYAHPGNGLRPHVAGKFIFVGDKKLYLRGATYGTFRPDANGNEFPDPQVVERDFAQMAANGLNALRTYTPPPRWFLDLAQWHGLYVMVGLPWEQHIAFLDKPRIRSIEERIRAGIRACCGHPAVLGYAIGNEIPASIVRWYGHRRIEHFLRRLYDAAKTEDPHGLVTYVNYPSTEYLQLSFLDFVCFNVYLESPVRFEAYLAHLHILAGDRPLIMAEIGLDSERNGAETQASALALQIRAAFAGGSAGVFVFAWTDEWYRGGHDIDDWTFGLTDRNRCPKPALAAVRQAFAETPFPPDGHRPRISVVVCTYNGARTIRSCLDSLRELKYPDFEVIVVDDGSTDATAAIANEYDVRLITIAQAGLSNARNVGLDAATGEIVAYLDDDALADPHWLDYLAWSFARTTHVGIGGPNIAPPPSGSIAACVAKAPGGPIHVLLSDTEAEHIPGCNMAFRKASLQAVGGFDPRYRSAGDDVDICWRLQRCGWTLGFSPAAMVWHHRRDSVGAYWKQQVGYGKAEALLESEWPEKYNAAGHLNWAGWVYGEGLARAFHWHRRRIYQGVWGSALFQSVYQPAPHGIWSLVLMPEWYLVIIALAAASALGLLWKPLLFVLPVFLVAVGALCLQACLGAAHTSFGATSRFVPRRLKLKMILAFLHLLQPLARLHGRMLCGLTPWRRRGISCYSLPLASTISIWSERWRSSDEWLRSLEVASRSCGATITRGGDFDRWDLSCQGGMFGSCRLLMAIEEHGSGEQMLRFHIWPRCAIPGLAALSVLATLAACAGIGGARLACLVLSLMVIAITLRMLHECSLSVGIIRLTLRMLKRPDQSSGPSHGSTTDRGSSATGPLGRALGDPSDIPLRDDAVAD